MTALLAAELLKLRTLRGTWGYVLTVIGLAALIAAGKIGSESRLGRIGPEFQGSLFADAGGATTLIALLFGLTVVTGEFRYGTITSALLTTPRRPVFLGAKLLAGSASGFMLAVTAVVVVSAVAGIWLSLIDVPLQFGEAAEPVARIFVAALVAGALGAGYGGVIHAQVPALVGALIWLLVAEPLLVAVLGALDIGAAGDYLPAAALFAIADPTAEGGLSFLPATVVGLGHVGLAATLAWLRTERRDIT
jgi:ABC-2 type transport system permease protein